MSVFKPLSSQDVIVTPFMVHKSFEFLTPESFETEGGEIHVGLNRFDRLFRPGVSFDVEANG